MLKQVLLGAVVALTAGPALAQTELPAPPAGPTIVQCNQGYQDGMPWTRQAFTAHCVKLRASNQGK